MLNQQHYQYIWSEKRSLINVESHIRQYIHERDIWGSSHDFSFIYARDLFAEELHRQEDNQQWIREGKRLFEKQFVKLLLSQGRDLRKNFKSFLSILNPKKLHLLSDTELADTFITSCQFHSRLRGFFKTSRQEFLTQAEHTLKRLLEEKVKSSQEAQKIFQRITFPCELDEVNKELVDRQNILARGTITRPVVTKHLRKYPWLVAHSHHKEQIIDNVVITLNKERKNLSSITTEVRHLFDHKKKLQREQEKIFHELNDKRIIYLSWLFRILSLERMKLKGGWSGSDFLYGDLYNEICQRTFIPLEDLYTVYRIDEVVQAIQLKRDILRAAEKKARKRAYVLWWNVGKLSFFSGEEALRIMDQVLEKVGGQKELKGQIASKGVYTGVACLIFPGDLAMLEHARKKFKRGDVLVTTMTQPNMVPLMKLAGAIVTDEGGLTSHAAIIARELRVPCIVGTKVGTKVIRDGNKVEVDAERGIVNIKSKKV